MSVDGIEPEEELDLLGGLLGPDALVPPEVEQLAEHGVGAALLLLPQPPVHRQLLVGHPHVL